MNLSWFPKLLIVPAALACFFGPLGNTSSSLLVCFLIIAIYMMRDARGVGQAILQGMPRPLLIFVALFFVNAAFSTNRLVSCAFAVCFAGVITLAMVQGKFLVDVTKGKRFILYTAFLLGTAAMCAYSVYSYLVLHLPRAKAPFTGENGLGTLAVATACICVGLAMSKDTDKRLRIVSGLLAPACIAALVLSQSRGAFLGMVAAFLYLTMWNRRLAAALAACGAATMLLVKSNAIIWQRYLTILSGAQAGDRIPAWKATLQMISDYPLTGIGMGTYVLVYPKYRLPGTSDTIISFAHNIFLQIGAELGVISLIIFIWLIVLALKDGIRASFTSWEARGLTAGLIGILVHQQVDCTIYSAEVGGFFWIAIGVLFHIGNNLPDKQQPNPKSSTLDTTAASALDER